MKPWEKCKYPNKCLLSDEGAILINNCLPDENTTITDMLRKFVRPDNTTIISPENLTHLIIGAHVNIYKVVDGDNVVEYRKGKLNYLHHRVCFFFLFKYHLVAVLARFSGTM